MANARETETEARRHNRHVVICRTSKTGSFTCGLADNCESMYYTALAVLTKGREYTTFTCYMSCTSCIHELYIMYTCY